MLLTGLQTLHGVMTGNVGLLLMTPEEAGLKPLRKQPFGWGGELSRRQYSKHAHLHATIQAAEEGADAGGLCCARWAALAGWKKAVASVEPAGARAVLLPVSSTHLHGLAPSLECTLAGPFSAEPFWHIGLSVDM